MQQGGLKSTRGVGVQSVTPPPSKNKEGGQGGGTHGGRYQRDPLSDTIKIAGLPSGSLSISCDWMVGEGVGGDPPLPFID